MPELPISTNHQVHLARLQWLLDYLTGERQQLESDLHFVLERGQRIEAELIGFLRTNYGVDARTTAVHVDTDRGVIVTPDPEPAPEPATASEEAPESAQAEPAASVPALVATRPPVQLNRAQRRHG